MSPYFIGGLSDSEQQAVRNIQMYIDEAVARIPRKYDEVKGFFDQATEVLEKDVLPLYKHNASLLMSMVHPDNSRIFRDRVREGDSTKTIDRLPIILGYMFDDGAYEAYHTASMKWFKSAHIKYAVDGLRKAFDYYDQRIDDAGFVKRTRGQVEEALKLVNQIIGNPDIYNDTGIKREVRAALPEMQKLVTRLEGYLA